MAGLVNLRTMAESLKGLLKPSTVPFPRRQVPVAEGFRGKPLYDREKCTGCGACRWVCPAGAISVVDEEAKRIVRVWHGHCAFCGRCEDSCPWGAVKLSQEFIIVVASKEEAEDKVELELARCPVCGSTVTAARHLSKAVEAVKEALSKRGASMDEYRSLASLCLRCRAKVDAVKRAHAFMLKMG
ncbi:MAG: 4Fe-4S binding protein [Candidatus Nezhaarchaeota archaeon]|nr:4Fe-4S binding protein [Candidatus Nezhaarchaeota archaeon]